MHTSPRKSTPDLRSATGRRMVPPMRNRYREPLEWILDLCMAAIIVAAICVFTIRWMFFP